jgi:hypothetical protein
MNQFFSKILYGSVKKKINLLPSDIKAIVCRFIDHLWRGDVVPVMILVVLVKKRSIYDREKNKRLIAQHRVQRNEALKIKPPMPIRLRVNDVSEQQRLKRLLPLYSL